MDFVLTLDEALRAGAIIRGIDIGEDEVRLGEEMAAPVREWVTDRATSVPRRRSSIERGGRGSGNRMEEIGRQ
jgi:hypothetical protein